MQIPELVFCAPPNSFKQENSAPQTDSGVGTCGPDNRKILVVNKNLRSLVSVCLVRGNLGYFSSNFCHSGKNSARENSVPILILPGKNYCPIQLGVEKYIDRREAPEIFENFLHIIGIFVLIKFNNP